MVFRCRSESLLDKKWALEHPSLVNSPDLHKINLELQYNSLVTLGNFYGLDIYFDWQAINEQLRPFETDWKQYNPRKSHIPRFGLSLTSLDGGLSGYPDLDSITEYNKKNDTLLNEESFTTATEVLKQCGALRSHIEPFLPYLGRSHLIRLNEGGYFPFHRDSQAFGAGTFRLISPLNNCSSNSFCFLYNQQRIQLNEHQLYFMNTKIDHALFSFRDDAVLLVLNVIVSEESTNCVRRYLAAN